MPGHVLVNFVVKYVKKLVPKYNLPHASTMRQALAKGRYLQYIAGDQQPGHRLPAIYRRHHGSLQGAMLTHRNMIANVISASVSMVPCWSGARSSWSRRCRSTTSFAPRTARRSCACAALQPAHQQPPRHPGLCQRDQEGPFLSPASQGSTPCSRPGQQWRVPGLTRFVAQLNQLATKATRSIRSRPTWRTPVLAFG